MWTPGTRLMWTPGTRLMWTPRTRLVWTPGTRLVWTSGTRLVWTPGTRLMYTLYMWPYLHKPPLLIMRKIKFFSTDNCSPPTEKIGKNVLLLQGDEVFVYYLRTSATCHSTFRVRETKRFKTVLYVYQYRYTVSWTDVNGKLVCAMGRHGFLLYFP